MIVLWQNSNLHTICLYPMKMCVTFFICFKSLFVRVTLHFLVCKMYLILYLIETPFNTFANRAGPDQAALQELPDQGLLRLLMEI